MTPEVAVSAWLDGTPTEAGGTLVVAVRAPEQGELDVPEPQVAGLDFRSGPARVEDLGDERLVTVRIPFSGDVGMYEIPSLVAAWHDPGGNTVLGRSTPLWVDLGVAPPRQGDPEDIVEPDVASWGPWLAAGAVVASTGLVAAGLWFALRRRPAPVAPPADPPDVVALRAWAAVRSDPRLDALGKALGLSRIFREYVEAVLAFPATAWTTTQSLDHLRSLPHLPDPDLPRARRLLHATDRIKYADARATEDLFDDLDGDLRGFIGDTRPRRVEPP